MSLAKAIAHGKERRKEYRGSKRFDSHCRNHGVCGYCRGNRTFDRNYLAAVTDFREASK